MDSSSSRLDNEGEFDDALTHQDDHQNDVGEKFEEPKDSMTLILDEELNDEEENVVLPKMLKDDEKVEEPKESMTFSSIEEVRSYYRTYAKQAGFRIMQRTSRKTDGKKSYAVIICTRGAPERTRTSNVAKPTPATTRTKCGAKICATLCDDEMWFLSKVELKHNHSLYSGKTRFFKCNEKVEEPNESMTFSSIEEVCSYYRTYAKQAGFGIAQRTSRKTDGKKSYAVIICTRGAPERTKTSDVAKPSPATTRTKCGAKICATLCDDGTWFLSKVELKHNHSLIPGKVRFFKCNKRIRRLELTDRVGIRTSKNFNSLVVESGGFESLSFGESDCRNYINKARELRLGKGGAQTLCDYFSRMQNQNVGFYFAMDMDDDCRLRNVFWADARSRAAYDFFGDVITFDTTYLTNRYDMPFASFVGVNHHGQSILLGIGLISSEDTDTFVWLFKSWLGCMNGRAPRAIITDQNRAMKNAIAIVFPETRHGYCLWHIMKKLSEKFGSHANFDGIKSALNTCLYDSQTCEEYEENWKDLLERYHLHDNAWLHELYMEKTFWVPAYMKDTFWAGMDTTQRSESINSSFDGYVHSQTTLKEFVNQYDSALRKMVESEARADFDSFNRTIPCISALQLEKQFQVVYTNVKFKEVHEQFVKVMSCNNSHLKSEGEISTFEVIESIVVGDHIIEKTFLVYLNEDELDVKCTCALFEVRGILCGHSLSVLRTKKVTTLPPRYFLDRWRKDIKREYSVGDNLNAHIHDKLRNNFEELLLLTSGNVERCMNLMKRMDKLKELWRCESRSSHDISAAVASSQVNLPIDPRNLLSILVSQHKYQEAFTTALQTRDVSIVNWLCSQVDLRWVLTKDPLPLSQEVLLQLLWLLPYCINTNPAEIIAWMTDVFNSIIPTDPAIEMHVQRIFNEVYAALNHLSVLPTITNDVRSIIRLLMKSLLPR